MNLLKTFESRISDAFNAGQQNLAAPFSFKKLAKQAAREMEDQTFDIEGVTTAPALYTILVCAADDALMRPYYANLTREIVSFIEAQAQAKDYVFVGKPLARFMVDPGLKPGKFAIFAENIDRPTLERLRAEEQAFLSGSTGLGGAAAGTGQERRGRAGSMQAQTPVVQPAVGVAPVNARPVSAANAVSLTQIPEQVSPYAQAGQGVDFDGAPVAGAAAYAQAGTNVPNTYLDESVGLSILPSDLEESISALTPQAKDTASAQADIAQDIAQAGVAAHAIAGAVPPVAYQPPTGNEDSIMMPPTPTPAPMSAVAPPTQRRNVPLVNPQRNAATNQAIPQAQCLLIDHQSGKTYTVTGPICVLGRERAPQGIMLRDPNVSRRHAELTFTGSGWTITDLNSTNGTMVNNVDISQSPLHTGDTITIGLINLEFREI